MYEHIDTLDTPMNTSSTELVERVTLDFGYMDPDLEHGDWDYRVLDLKPFLMIEKKYPDLWVDIV